MHPFAGTSLEIILSGLTAAFVAQLIKFFIYWLTQRQVNFRLFFQTGGMPSSHSAWMVAMATSVGLIEGFDSTLFAVAFGIAMIVMYDAAGLRRSAGKMAGVLNAIVADIYTDHQERFPERLMELLGHTPIEVIVGGIQGFFTAYLFHLKMSGGL
ncbi:MAG: divergent PAP2 family protein [Candidatus Melainabacteria bacterium]